MTRRRMINMDWLRRAREGLGSPDEKSGQAM